MKNELFDTLMHPLIYKTTQTIKDALHTMNTMQIQLHLQLYSQ
jgi:hypothetical protein